MKGTLSLLVNADDINLMDVDTRTEERNADLILMLIRILVQRYTQEKLSTWKQEDDKQEVGHDDK